MKQCKYCENTNKLMTRVEGNFLSTVCQQCLDDFNNGNKPDPLCQMMLDGKGGGHLYLTEEIVAHLKSIGYNTDKVVVSKPLPELGTDYPMIGLNTTVASEFTKEDLEDMKRMFDQ